MFELLASMVAITAVIAIAMSLLSRCHCYRAVDPLDSRGVVRGKSSWGGGGRYDRVHSCSYKGFHMPMYLFERKRAGEVTTGADNRFCPRYIPPQLH